ncbi:MAG: hypothetical protein C0469_14830 [Cyanobacteria bacterium DS2.3.42]|nr:hypothetical protein [Cyanobacteria bacterium DS2.3.42]
MLWFRALISFPLDACRPGPETHRTRGARSNLAGYFSGRGVNPYWADKLIMPFRCCIKHLMYFLMLLEGFLASCDFALDVSGGDLMRNLRIQLTLEVIGLSGSHRD